jgi:hypothetical protein
MILRNVKFSEKILRKIFWKIFHLTSLPRTPALVLPANVSAVLLSNPQQILR